MRKPKSRKRPEKTKKTSDKTTPKRALQQSQSQNLLRRKPHKPFNNKLNEIQDNRDLRPKRNKLISGRSALVVYAAYRELVRFKTTPRRLKHKVIPAEPGHRFSLRYTVRRKFLDSNKTVVCWRRKIRRAVLFANKKTGKGSAKRKHIYTENSNISCRRK